MEVFVPVSAVAIPTTQPYEPIQNSEGAAARAPEEAPGFAPLVSFLQDHFVKGSYQGGKLVFDLIRTIQNSADENKTEFLRNLPSLGRRLCDLPAAFGALLSEDPAAMRAVERQFGALSRDVASATSTGVLFGISRLISTATPFTVAAGAVLGAAVGGERIHTLVQYARATIKED
jgi:hypothetical protein